MNWDARKDHRGIRQILSERPRDFQRSRVSLILGNPHSSVPISHGRFADAAQNIYRESWPRSRYNILINKLTLHIISCILYIILFIIVYIVIIYMTLSSIYLFINLIIVFLFQYYFNII